MDSYTKTVWSVRCGAYVGQSHTEVIRKGYREREQEETYERQPVHQISPQELAHAPEEQRASAHSEDEECEGEDGCL